MLSIEITTLFLITTILLAFAPGPDNIFVLTLSAMHGFKAGMCVILGLCTGIVVHTSVVAFGIAVIFSTSVVAFNILKMVGAMYLFYLAWQAFRAGAKNIDGIEPVEISWKVLYLRGVIMNVTNPKVAIFFLAFLPQFIDSSKAVILQTYQLGCLAILATIFVFSIFAWTAGYLRQWFKASSKAQIIINRVAGTIFAGLALKLVVSER